MSGTPDPRNPVLQTLPLQACMYCRLPRGQWSAPCKKSPDQFHWTAAEKLKSLEAQIETCHRHLRAANRLLLAGARAIAATRVRGRRARRRALRDLPARPDSLELETEAAKISDTIAIYTGDQSLPVGPMFDRLEGGS